MNTCKVIHTKNHRTFRYHVIILLIDFRNIRHELYYFTWYFLLDIRTNIKRGCSSHIRRYKIACGLIESIKKSVRARSFPFFYNRNLREHSLYRYMYHRLSTTDHGDIWSGHGPPVVGVTNLQIDLNRSSTIMLDN